MGHYTAKIVRVAQCKYSNNNVIITVFCLFHTGVCLLHSVANTDQLYVLAFVHMT